MKPSVVIIDCNRNGLASIRSLGKAGCKVIAVDHHWAKAGQYSKYVYKRYKFPKPGKDPKALVQGLVQIASDFSDDDLYLLPVNDEYVQLLAENQSLLSDFKALYETDVTVLNKISNKLQFADFVNHISIPQPKQFSKSDVENGTVTWPVIIKPDNRRATDNLSKGLFKVKLCENDQVASKFIAELESKLSPYILQEFIPGGDDELFTAGIAAWDGKLLGCFTGRKVRQYPPKAGQATLAEIVFDQKLVDYSEKIISELNYSGIAQIEYKKYEDDFYVIEMNQRSWSWHSLAQYAGVNLPMITLDAARGEKPSSPQLNKIDQGEWYYFVEDFIYNFILNRNVSLRSMVRSSLASEAHAFFDSKDIMPWVIYMIYELPLRIVQLVLGKNRKVDIH